MLAFTLLLVVYLVKCSLTKGDASKNTAGLLLQWMAKKKKWKTKRFSTEVVFHKRFSKKRFCLFLSEGIFQHKPYSSVQSKSLLKHKSVNHSRMNCFSLKNAVLSALQGRKLHVSLFLVCWEKQGTWLACSANSQQAVFLLAYNTPPVLTDCYSNQSHSLSGIIIN